LANIYVKFWCRKIVKIYCF